MVAPAPRPATSDRNRPAPPALPDALRPYADQPRWVVWRSGPARKGGKRPKIPYLPSTGRPVTGAALAPGMGGTFAEATRALVRGRFDGIGLILGDGLVGVDFDACIDVTGTIAPRVADDLAALNTYTEYSPSGTGVHALALGALPGCWKAGYCEGYDRDRFFTFTGRPIAMSAPTIRAAQATLDALHARWAPRGAASEAPRPIGAPAPAGSAESGFWREVSFWQAHERRLLRPDGLPHAPSPQLLAYERTRVLPAALRAKGDSPSEGRAFIVRQLRLPGYAYGEAESYVIARRLWARYGFDTKIEKELIADFWRLIRDNNPIASHQLHPASIARAEAYAAAVAAGAAGAVAAPAVPEPEPAAPARRAATDPAAYLAALAAVAVGGVVMEGRAARAALADLNLKTAQRVEARLVAEGAIRLTHARTSTGRISYVQILKRINTPDRADVQTPPSEGITTPQTEDAASNARGKDTGCPGGGAPVPEPEPAAAPALALAAAAPTPPALPSLPSPRLSLADLVADALDAYGTAGGRAALARVVRHVRTVGGLKASDGAIERAYRAELARRKYARADENLRRSAEKLSPTRRRAKLRNLERSIAADLKLASDLRIDPLALDGQRRSDKTPAQLEARAYVWAKQYAIIAQVHEERSALTPEIEEAALLADVNAVLDRIRAKAGAPAPRATFAPTAPQGAQAPPRVVSRPAPTPAPDLPAGPPDGAAGMIARLQARKLAQCAD